MQAEKHFAGQGMAIEYRVYAIGQDGRIFDAKVLVCEDDAEAVEKAKNAFEGIIEVWSGARFLAKLDTRD